MAGQKSNTIEYVFQGDTLDLQQAIKKVDSLLRKSTKTYKGFQGGVLTDDQKQKVKATRKLLKSLRTVAKEEATLDAEQRKRTLVAGREALKQAAQFAKQAAQAEMSHKKRMAEAEIKQQKQVELEKQRMAELTSVAGQERAKQDVAFLEAYADKLKRQLSPEAYEEIKNAAADYNAAIADTTLRHEDLALATAQLQDVYKKYASILQVAVRAQESARKSITSLNAFMHQAKINVQATLKSFSFWAQLLRRTVALIQQGVTDAADYAESINYLNAVTGECNAQLKEFITQQERAFGTDPTQLRTSVAMFYQFGDSLGWSSKEASLLAENATKLAQDLSSLQNVELDVATEKLRSAFSGQTRALQAWGISVHDASIEEWLLSKGINKSMDSMSEASQAAARYAFVLEKTTEAQGDLSRTIQSPANQFHILNTQTQLLWQNLGALVIPTVSTFVRVLNGALQPINAFLQAFTAASAESFTSSIGEGSEALEELGAAGEEASAGLTGIDEINQAGNPADSMDDYTAGIEEQIASLLSGYDNTADKANVLTETLGALGEALAPVNAVLSSSPMDFANVFTFLGGALEILIWPLEKIGQVFQIMPNWLQTVVGGLTQVATAILVTAAALAVFKTLTGSSVFSAFVKVLKSMWTSFVSVGKAIFVGTKNLIANKGATIRATIASKAAGLMIWWETAAWWAKAIAVIAAAGALALVVAATVAGATAVIGSQRSSEMSGETEAPAVPAMATGGVVKQPTLALVGEGKYEEAVVPLGNSPQFKAMKQSIAEETANRVSYGSSTARAHEYSSPASRSPSAGRSAGGSTSGVGRPIILTLNGREVARALLPEFAYTQTQTGVKLKK